MNALHRKEDPLSRWVCFRLEGQLYGLPIASVQEVLASVEIEPVPGAAAQIMGLINRRGAVLTVIDLRLHLGLPPDTDPGRGAVVIFEDQDERFALRVDAIDQVRKLLDSVIKPAPLVGAPALQARIHGIYTRDGEMLTLLDADALLGEAQFVT